MTRSPPFRQLNIPAAATWPAGIYSKTEINTPPIRIAISALLKIILFSSSVLLPRLKLSNNRNCKMKIIRVLHFLSAAAAILYMFFRPCLIRFSSACADQPLQSFTLSLALHNSTISPDICSRYVASFVPGRHQRRPQSKPVFVTMSRVGSTCDNYDPPGCNWPLSSRQMLKTLRQFTCEGV